MHDIRQEECIVKPGSKTVLRGWLDPISRHARLFAPLLLLLVGTDTFAQTVKIRLVNSTNGSPVADRKILIFGLSAKTNVQQENPPELLGKHATPDLHLSTDANGETQFDLPIPAPAHFYVHAELHGPVWDCTCLVRVLTEEMLQKGLTISNAQDGRSPGKFSIQQKAGEVVFRLKPTPWWVQVFWPFLIDHRL